MRLSSVLVTAAALMGSAVSQMEELLSQMPDCAVGCLDETLQVTSCDPSDMACLCQDEAFMNAAQVCQAGACTVKEVLTSTNATVNACQVPPGDQTGPMIGIPASFGSFAIIIVAVRVFDRTVLRHDTLGLDDYLVIVAGICAIVLNYICIPMTRYGMGSDLWTIEFPNINTTLKLLYIAEVFYMFAEMCVQLSILVFYFRVFPKSSTLIQVGSWTLTGIVVCFGIANTLTMIFQCTPIPFFWESWAAETTGTCIDISLYSWVRAAIEIVVDVCIMALPLPSLLKLQLSGKRKVLVLGMFLVGFVITIVSCLRLQSLLQFAKTQNPTLDNAPAVYWSVLECDMFIICACLPALRSVLVRLAPGVFSTLDERSYPTPKNTTGSNRGYQRQGSIRELDDLSNPAGVVKTVDVDVYRTERSASDEVLVEPRKIPGI